MLWLQVSHKYIICKHMFINDFGWFWTHQWLPTHVHHVPSWLKRPSFVLGAGAGRATCRRGAGGTRGRRGVGAVWGFRWPWGDWNFGSSTLVVQVICAMVKVVAIFWMGKIPPLMTGILIMGPYKPLRTWADEFTVYPLLYRIIGSLDPSTYRE